jgi:hypothetical protein
MDRISCWNAGTNCLDLECLEEADHIPPHQAQFILTSNLRFVKGKAPIRFFGGSLPIGWRSPIVTAHRNSITGPALALISSASFRCHDPSAAAGAWAADLAEHPRPALASVGCRGKTVHSV